MDWFLYERDLRHERVKNNFIGLLSYQIFNFQYIPDKLTGFQVG